MNIWKLGNPVRIFGFNRQMVKARPMKTAFTPFDRLVEQHYLGAYQIAVALVSDPLVATRVTDRVFRHLRDLAGTHGNLVLTRRMLAKIVYLESAADSLRIATAERGLPERFAPANALSRIASEFCDSVGARCDAGLLAKYADEV
jgi:hypothetical protein